VGRGLLFGSDGSGEDGATALVEASRVANIHSSSVALRFLGLLTSGLGGVALMVGFVARRGRPRGPLRAPPARSEPLEVVSSVPSNPPHLVFLGCGDMLGLVLQYVKGVRRGAAELSRERRRSEAWRKTDC